MHNFADHINVTRQLLELYKVAQHVDPEAIKNFAVYDSPLYGMAKVYSFDYKHVRYYISDDHSLMDNPKFLRDILKDINPDLKGNPVKNPVLQPDGAQYASGLKGKEYYLWEAPLS